MRGNVEAAKKEHDMVVGYVGMHGGGKVLLRNLQHLVSARHAQGRAQEQERVRQDSPRLEPLPRPEPLPRAPQAPAGLLLIEGPQSP